MKILLILLMAFLLSGCLDAGDFTNKAPVITAQATDGYKAINPDKHPLKWMCENGEELQCDPTPTNIKWHSMVSSNNKNNNTGSTVYV